MDDRGTDFGQLIYFARLKMDGMAINAPRAQKPVLRIGVEIIARCGEELAHPSDFLGLL